MNKGFTLIELLAVLIILGIIMSIVTVSISTILSNSRKSLSETQKRNIEQAAKTYYLKEGMSNDDNCVNVQELIQKGYVEGADVKDPKTGENMQGSVEITYASNQYSYTYQESSCE